MGANCSCCRPSDTKTSHVQLGFGAASPKHKVLKHFKPFDEPLAAAFATGAIALLDADLLRAGALPALARRQDLEERERAGGPALLLPPADAAAALRAADRRVCFVTYGWRSCVHPDPDGATLGELLGFLRGPLGAHVVGVFVDFACLHQNPRTEEQDIAFGAALKVMANGCAPPARSARDPAPRRRAASQVRLAARHDGRALCDHSTVPQRARIRRRHLQGAGKRGRCGARRARRRRPHGGVAGVRRGQARVARGAGLGGGGGGGGG